MLIASTSLIVLFVTVSVCLRTSKLRPLERKDIKRPLDRKDINRVRLFSDRVHREEVYPHEY